MVYRRKARKNIRRKRVARKRVARRRNSNGVIHLTRRLPEQNVYNNTVAGTMSASSSTVIVGTPYQTPAFAGSTYYNVPFTADFQLNDLINFTELTAISDKYKIKWVKIVAWCNSNVASVAGTGQLPSMLYCMDDDDVSMPASNTTGLQTIREKMGAKLKQWQQNKPITFFIRPKILSSVNGPVGTPVSSAVISSRFLDCAHSDIPHYGMKGYLQDVNLAATPAVYTQFKFDITYGVTLKGIQ